MKFTVRTEDGKLVVLETTALRGSASSEELGDIKVSSPTGHERYFPWINPGVRVYLTGEKLQETEPVLVMSVHVKAKKTLGNDPIYWFSEGEEVEISIIHRDTGTCHIQSPDGEKKADKIHIEDLALS
jgi:hypothetical protein